jgi:large subunit ribosomal protein L32
MAVPKKKVSRSRRNMRRFAGGNRIEKVTTGMCPQCNEAKRPHRVCSGCGFYEGKSVVTGRQPALQA